MSFFGGNMTTRRSSRVRTRESDSADASTGDAGRTTQPSKRARGGASAPAKVSRDSSSAALPWRHQALPSAKRAEWDAFLQTHFHLYDCQELYDVYELARHLNPEKPLDAFVETAGLRLTGPFDLLKQSGGMVQASLPLYLHGRFFLDPAEVVTVAEGTRTSSGAHWGLHRDGPKQQPGSIVFAPDAAVCRFDVAHRTLTELLRTRLEAEAASAHSDHPVYEHLTQVKALITTITKGDIGSTSIQSQRTKKQTAASLSGLGISVPYDTKKRQGFRELPIVGDDLRDLLQHVEAGDSSARKKLSGLITRATIANDECDFGTSLLLGLDLFTRGRALQKEALQLLRVAYMLLNRKEFAKVTSDHVKHRTESSESLRCLVADASAGGATSVHLP